MGTLIVALPFLVHLATATPGSFENGAGNDFVLLGGVHLLICCICDATNLALVVISLDPDILWRAVSIPPILHGW